MLYHAFSWNNTTLFQVGTYGVYLFFILSGFSMWYVYAPRALSTDMVKAFFVARFARIFPLYFLACILATAARCYAQGTQSVTSLEFLHKFLLNVTFLFGVDNTGKNSIVPGGWSIGIEWVFYILFPLLLLFARSGRVMAVLLAGGVILNYVCANAALAHTTLVDGWVDYTHFSVFFVYFIAGIVTAELYERTRTRFTGNAWPWLARLMPLAAIAFVFFYPSATVEDYLTGYHTIALLVASMLAVFFASLLTQPSRLEVRAYHFLGDISYGVYLLNFFVYNAFDIAFKHLYPTHGVLSLAAIFSVSTIILASAVYRFYESPLRTKLNSLFKSGL